MAVVNLKLGEILVRQGVLKPEAMSQALDEQKKTGLRLTQVVIQSGATTESEVLKALEKSYQVPGVDLGKFSIQIAATEMISKDVCEKYCLIPVQKVGQSTLVVAMSDPSNSTVKDDLRILSKCKIQPVVATELSITAAIEKFYSSKVQDMARALELETARQQAEEQASQSALTGKESILFSEKEEQTPIVKFVNTVLQDAIKRKASDIHFEPYEKRFRVRFRVDGVMIEAATQSQASAPAISSRLKIMSKLDIAERRKPQDGRLKLPLSNGREMDFRVSVLPTIWGEKIVMRLLDKSNLQLDMTKLGMEPEDLALFKEAIARPQGLLLITGPTGSGKTTTIYSALAELNQPDINLSTAEDPVEFNLEGINQVQMNPEIGLTFSSALRSFLRQDPDVIMVGEIRDLETAEIAIKAASTGHLVVSTLHTNDAPQTVIRLTEMGIPNYIVTSVVHLVVAQRLVGRICESCKTPVKVDRATLLKIGVEESEIGTFQVYKGKGCNVCNGTGIKGRRAIFEIMPMTEEIKDAILSGANASELRNLARSQGMRTLRRSALLKLKRGETSIEEVLNSSVSDTL